MKPAIYTLSILTSLLLFGCPSSIPRLDPQFYINGVLNTFGPTQVFSVGQELVLTEKLRIATSTEGYANQIKLETIQDYNLYGYFVFSPIDDPNYIAPKCNPYLAWYENVVDVTDVECHDPKNYFLPTGIDQIDPVIGENRSPSLLVVTYDEINHVITTTVKIKLTKVGTFQVGLAFLSNAKDKPLTDWKNIRLFHGAGQPIIVK